MGPQLCRFEERAGNLVCAACNRAAQRGDVKPRRRCAAVRLDAIPPRRSSPCRHLGAAVGFRPCEGCAGNVRVKEFSCLHPARERTTLRECTQCEDFSPVGPPADSTRTLLLRFWHGLGDHIQLGVVLRHLQALHPEWTVDLACHGDKADGLLQAGLCRAIVPPDHDGDYDVVRAMYFWEPDGGFADAPSTKAEKCLRDIFGVRPRAELSGYICEPSPDQTRRARAFAAFDSPFVLCHATGHSAREFKDLPMFAVEAAAVEAVKRGRRFFLLDLDRRGGWPSVFDSPVTPLNASDPVWLAGRPTAGQLAALAREADLCIGIDSGPGKVFAASGRPTITVWSGMHPVHYHGLSENVLHLVRADHARNIRDESGAARAFFEARYRHRVMTRNVGDELAQAVMEHLCR